MKANKAG